MLRRPLLQLDSHVGEDIAILKQPTDAAAADANLTSHSNLRDAVLFHVRVDLRDRDALVFFVVFLAKVVGVDALSFEWMPIELTTNTIVVWVVPCSFSSRNRCGGPDLE